MNLTAEVWNAMYPVGTPVRYWFFQLEKNRPPNEEHTYVDTRTRSEAWDIPSGSTLVLCEGRTGGLSVSHLMPLAQKDLSATKYGFKWGQVEVERTAEIKKNKVIAVKTQRSELHIRVTPTGFIRIDK